MEARIISYIFSEYEKFSDTEKKIASFIINNKERIIEMTIGELAAASEVSEASVSRFCKKCQMKSFHHLKITLAKEMVESDREKVPVSNHIDELNITQSLQNILANKIDELRETIENIESSQLKKILACIKKAGTVQFAAVGNTIPAALDGTYKFNQIGIPATANTIWETQLAYTYNLRKGDLVIIISNSGASKRLIQIGETAKEKGITVIGITNSRNSPIAQLSDYHITTATREKLFLDEYYFSRISAFAVIEVLYLFLTVGKTDVYKNISRHEQAIADDKI